jgi:RimJ/RimL family protein N-acetyltransferase
VRHEIVLEGDLVRLEPLTEAHAQALFDAASETDDPDLYRWTWVPRSPDAAREYIAKALGDNLFLPFATVRRADGRVVGSTRYEQYFWEWPVGHEHHGRTTPDAVEIGWTWLAASALRSGINTEAKLLMLAHAFDTWHVHSVRLTTDARNVRSQAAIERLGAHRDGVIRGIRPGADGSVRDSAWYSILAAEWPDVQRRLRQLLAR